MSLMFHHQLYGGTTNVPDGVVGMGTTDDGCTDTGWRYCGDTCIEYETKYRDDAHFCGFERHDILTSILT